MRSFSPFNLMRRDMRFSCRCWSSTPSRPFPSVAPSLFFFLSVLLRREELPSSPATCVFSTLRRFVDCRRFFDVSLSGGLSSAVFSAYSSAYEPKLLRSLIVSKSLPQSSSRSALLSAIVQSRKFLGLNFWAENDRSSLAKGFQTVSSKRRSESLPLRTHARAVRRANNKGVLAGRCAGAEPLRKFLPAFRN
jgi:hypothetical protein